MVPGAGGKLWQKHSGTIHISRQHIFEPFLTHLPTHITVKYENGTISQKSEDMKKSFV